MEGCFFCPPSIANRLDRFTGGAVADPFRQRTALDEGDAVWGAEYQRALVGDRWPHDAPCRLRHQSAHPQANRRSLRLDQDGLRTRANQVSRMRSRWMGLQIRCHRLQSDAAAEAVGGVGMSTPPNCQINRRRRTVKADICDRHHLARCARW